MKKILACLLVLLVSLGALSACGGKTTEEKNNNTQITLNGSSAEVKGGGAKAEGSVVTISAVGTYTVSGTLDNGKIVVDTGDDAMEVTLILNNANITNLEGPAIHVAQAKDLNLELADGSANTVTSGQEGMPYDENASGAAIYAEDDMDIDCDGSATLNVYGNINNGIACKNDLDINGGIINVYAVNNGVRGADSFEMKGGTLNVQAGNDGIKSVTADEEGKGYITIHDGAIKVDTAGDGISAETQLSVLGGNIEIVAEGIPDLGSCKGMKANHALVVEGGTVNIQSADHALQSNGQIVISDGSLTLVSLDGKGIAADADVTISGGSIALNSIEDGIETIANVNISGGSMNIVSGRDGIQAGEANSGKGDVNINGGDVLISADKLGVNARGQLSANGGSIIALGGENKILSNAQGCQQSLWEGAKGRTVTVSAGSEALGSIESKWTFKSVLFAFADKAAKEFSISDGVSSVQLAG